MATHMQTGGVMAEAVSASAGQHDNSGHCPFAGKSSASSEAEPEQTNGCGHCTNCLCSSSLGSVLAPSHPPYIKFDPTPHRLAFLPAAFPESPPGFILRPPIT